MGAYARPEPEILCELVRGGGLEPPITGPEPVVLPITPPPKGGAPRRAPGHSSRAPPTPRIDPRRRSRTSQPGRDLRQVRPTGHGSTLSPAGRRRSTMTDATAPDTGLDLDWSGLEVLSYAEC